jgi:16S rRNA (guanine527-N7)-methyltransferase
MKSASTEHVDRRSSRSRSATSTLHWNDEDRARALAMLHVSRETIERLDRFIDLLLTWQPKINLIAPSTVASVWVRHVADSLQILDLASSLPADSLRVWVDLGSGAGFPGLALACALREEAGSSVHLVESNAKKAAFLREAIRQTGAAAIVRQQRIEDFEIPKSIRVVTARGLAPLPQLLPMILPFVQKGAVALLPKGQDVGRELTEATKSWHIEVDLVPSKTDPAGRVLVVHGLAPKR